MLVARPSDAEAQLSFAALIDLCDGAGRSTALPAPQRAALEVALLRREPAGAPPEPHAIGLGAAQRAGRAARPCWSRSTTSSGSTRRPPRRSRSPRGGSTATPVGFLLARRPGAPSALEQALERRRSSASRSARSSAARSRALLAERLGLSLPAPLLRRIVDATLGNPLFALEVGRALAERAAGRRADLPVPAAVEELLGTRVAALPRADAPAAARGRAERRPAPGRAGGDRRRRRVDDALDAGVLCVDGDRVRAAHPLLAAAARDARAAERAARRCTRALADVVARAGAARAAPRARDRSSPTRTLAARVAAAAAARAAARGARPEAVALGEQALRLTPRRTIARAGTRAACSTLAGVPRGRGRAAAACTDLLTPELDALPPGRRRACARGCCSRRAAVDTRDENVARVERALAEAGDDPALRAPRARVQGAQHRGRGRRADSRGRGVGARGAAGELDADCGRLRAGLDARAARAADLDDVCARFARRPRTGAHLVDSPEPLAGAAAARGAARSSRRARTTTALPRARRRARRGASRYAWLRLNLCELELRAGEWDAAERLLDEWARLRRRPAPDHADLPALPRAAGRRSRRRRGGASAGRRPRSAEAEARGYRWQVLEALARARARRAARAATRRARPSACARCWAHCEREGVDEPGAFPVAPDLVEALAELGERDEARAVTERLRALRRAQEHPWAAGERAARARR